MPHISDSRVSAVTWPWRPASTPAASPHASLAATWLPPVVGCAVAAFVYLNFHRVLPAIVIASVAMTVLVCALFFPKAHGRIQDVFRRLGVLLGTLLAWLLLTPIFYLGMTAGRLILLIRGIDLMQLGMKPENQTYWQERSARKPGHFEKLY